MSPGHGAGKRGLICVLNVAANRNTTRKSSHFDFEGRQDFGKIKRRRIPFGIGVGRENDFPDFLLLYAFK